MVFNGEPPGLAAPERWDPHSAAEVAELSASPWLRTLCAIWRNPASRSRLYECPGCLQLAWQIGTGRRGRPHTTCSPACAVAVHRKQKREYARCRRGGPFHPQHVTVGFDTMPDGTLTITITTTETPGGHRRRLGSGSPVV
jgi:hypothetical protein